MIAEIFTLSYKSQNLRTLTAYVNENGAIERFVKEEMSDVDESTLKTEYDSKSDEFIYFIEEMTSGLHKYDQLEYERFMETLNTKMKRYTELTIITMNISAGGKNTHEMRATLDKFGNIVAVYEERFIAAHNEYFKHMYKEKDKDFEKKVRSFISYYYSGNSIETYVAFVNVLSEKMKRKYFKKFYIPKE